jgi:anti-sigma regulatory factor (Ser/Thr protein kinase)
MDRGDPPGGRTKMMGHSELRLNCIARREAARPMRHAVAAFLTAAGKIDPDFRADILTAVGEALANAVEHAYEGAEANEIELFARLDRNNTLAVDVFDRGTFIERAAPRPGRGFGMRIVEAIAEDVTINVEDGTHVRMIFNLAAQARRNKRAPGHPPSTPDGTTSR